MPVYFFVIFIAVHGAQFLYPSYLHHEGKPMVPQFLLDYLADGERRAFSGTGGWPGVVAVAVARWSSP